MVYVEGEQFAAGASATRMRRARAASRAGAESHTFGRGRPAERDGRRAQPGRRRRQLVRAAIVALVLAAIGIALTQAGVLPPRSVAAAGQPGRAVAGGEVVQPTESIGGRHPACAAGIASRGGAG